MSFFYHCRFIFLTIISSTTAGSYSLRLSVLPLQVHIPYDYQFYHCRFIFLTIISSTTAGSYSLRLSVLPLQVHIPYDYQFYHCRFIFLTIISSNPYFLAPFKCTFVFSTVHNFLFVIHNFLFVIHI